MICICLSAVEPWNDIRFRIYFNSKLLLVASTWTRLTNYVSGFNVFSVRVFAVMASDLRTGRDLLHQNKTGCGW